MTPSDERNMAGNKQNAPNQTTQDTKDVGGKTEIKKTEGGTIPSSTMDEVLAKTKPDSISSVSHEQAEQANKLVVTKEIEVSGTKAVIKGIDQEAVDKAEKAYRNDSDFIDNAIGGGLQGDKSRQSSQTLEEKFDEINRTAGPNPTPFREGNEITKLMEGRRFEDFAMALRNLALLGPALQKMVDDDKFSKENKEVIVKVQKELLVIA